MKNLASFPNSPKALRATIWCAAFVLSLVVFSATSSTSAQQGQLLRVEGELEVVYEDSPGRGRLLHFLNVGGRRLQVRFAHEPPQTLRTGMRVVMSGVQVGETLEMNAGDSMSVASGSAQVASSSMGQHRVLVMMVNFQDKQTQPFTREQAQAVMFGTTNDYFREASYGQTWLSGDVYGWYTIPVSSTTCDTTAISNYAQQAAAAAGANLAAYDHFVYAFPQNACTWQGRGSVGGSPSQAWINEWFELGIVGHELGHNFGLYHSRSMDCGSSSIGSDCTASEYGDLFDLMGGANSAHFNVFQKERLGWVNSGINAPITTVATSGTYWLDSYATGSMNPKGLKILKSTDPVTGMKTWYYIERRGAVGFDSFVSGNQNILNGVIVRTGSESSGQLTYLLDMTPATASWYDPALTVGQSFTDNDARVTIATLSADAAGALVNVTIAAEPCVRANPTVTVTPAQSPWMPAGSTASYTVSVRNNDGNSCGASGFNTQAIVPSGWTSSASTPAIDPGSTATISVQVTSPVGVSDGYYGLTVKSQNTGSTSNSGSAQVTYSLICTLSVSNVATQATYMRNQTATVNATVKAGGMPLAGAAVTFTLTKSNGTTVNSTATTGSNGVATFKYSFNRKKDPTGTYQVRAQASANGVSGVGTVSFTVK